MTRWYWLSLVALAASQTGCGRFGDGGTAPLTALPIQRDQAPNGVVVIAHRGDSKLAPENTLSAFHSAVAGGADYVELDSRVSTDGTIWCWHDKDMDRTSDAVKVLGREKIPFAEMSDADLAKLDAGAWFDPRFVGERVARLDAALDVIQAGSITLLERKTGSAKAHVDVLRAKGLLGRLIVQAFDWKFLADLHALEPDQIMAALGDKVIDDARWDELAKTGVRIIAWNFQDTTPEMITEARRRGYRFWVWTVDEPADWDRMLVAGVDGIITNRPRDLIAHMRSKS
ncbi:MAG: hypothetical protein JXA69_02505 [Phycisphaerae bacterium]|nr:hypothetical protein [Phycisphaerae bacterium]